MMEKVLDLSRLRSETVPLLAVLFVSTALGVIAGLLLLFVAAAIGTALVPGGFVASLFAIVSAGIYGAQLAAMGVAAIVLIPLGAILAAHLKLAGMASYIVERSGAQVLKDSDREGTAVAAMARKAGLPKPPRYAVIGNAVNAFAMSADPSEGLVFIGRPLQDALRPQEVRAIIGHELGHIAMDDGRRKLLAMGHQEFLVVFLGFSGLKRVARTCFGLIGELALAAHSREREYWADAVGAYVTSKDDMISALRTLGIVVNDAPTPVEREFAPLMLRSAFQGLFATHPSFEQRIAALENETYLRRLPERVAAPAVPPEVPAPPTIIYDGI